MDKSVNDVVSPVRLVIGIADSDTGGNFAQAKTDRFLPEQLLKNIPL
ncbi:hypothetical protein [Microcystis aeruginosa]|nr:hypothetical protein [Microcystis aeruginosa]MDB9387761.1 hypothetical protein [Microcystis aeruginosa CS-583]ODV40355.1 hypothetical protein BFG60_0102 [Microcystis aeruginosa NIES-98]